MGTLIDGVVRTNAPSLAVTGTVALTGGSVANIFTISGGPVLVEALFAEVTTAVSADACDTKLVMDPTNGADTDICVALDITGAAQYSFFYLDGTIGNAMVNAVPGTALPLAVGMDVPLVLPIGTVDLSLANSDPDTGACIWYMRYRPLKNGASVAGVS